MIGVGTRRWNSLEKRSPRLFLVAGLVLAVYAALNGVAAFTDVAYETVESVVGPAGFVLGFVGLLGLYPPLADRSPKLARAGAAFAASGAVGFSVISATNLGRLAGVVPEEPLAWFPALLALVVVGMVPGFLSFAAAVLRTGVRSRTLGLLLPAPATIFAAMAVGGVVFGGVAVGAFLISSGQALAHLAIGYTLRTGPTPIDSETPAGDVTVG